MPNFARKKLLSFWQNWSDYLGCSVPAEQTMTVNAETLREYPPWSSSWKLLRCPWKPARGVLGPPVLLSAHILYLIPTFLLSKSARRPCGLHSWSVLKVVPLISMTPAILSRAYCIACAEAPAIPFTYLLVGSCSHHNAPSKGTMTISLLPETAAE